MNLEKKLRLLQKGLRTGLYTRQLVSGCIGVTVLCGAGLGRYIYESKQADSAMEALRQAKEEAAESAAENDGDEDALTVDTEGGDSLTVQKTYEELFKQNPDLVGWLTIDGTKIDYPVMWTPEDPEYYSNRGFDKAESKNGLLFMDELCDVNNEGGNIIIYGHNMKNGSMFADLMNYKKESYYKQHPMIQFDTLYDSRLYEVAAVLKSDDLTELPYAFIDSDDEDAKTVLKTAKENSLYSIDVELDTGAEYLTLSTCDYSKTDGRLVVLARRIK